MASLTNDGAPRDKPKNYFGLIKFVLKVVGISIDGNDSATYKIYSILVVVFFNIAYPILDFLESFKHEFAVVVENMLMYIFGLSLASAKTAVIILKRRKFAQLLNKLEQEPFTSNPDRDRGGEEEDKLIRKCAWLTNVQAFAYGSVSLASVIAVVSTSLTNRIRSSDYRDWVLPYGPFTVLNITYSPNYEITLMYQVTCVTYLSVQFVSVDLITAAVLAHISYQLRILQINLQRISRISYEKMLKETEFANLLPEPTVEIDGSVIPWKYLKKSLKETIDYHLAIISIAEEVESLFSRLLLTVFLSTLVMICFLLYKTSLIYYGDPKIWNSVIAVVCASMQVATVCYWGDQVMFESQEVGRAAYEANFVGTDLRFQKSLALIIRRSQKPINITAGKFSVISLPTFVWIIQTSYSYFMVFKKTQTND